MIYKEKREVRDELTRLQRRDTTFEIAPLGGQSGRWLERLPAVDQGGLLTIAYARIATLRLSDCA